MTIKITAAVRSHPGAGDHIRRLLTICGREQLTLPQKAYVLATVHHESKMGMWMLDQVSGWTYEGRHFLGNLEPGDGPRFRGRGYVRIVGRSQYALWERHLGLPLLEAPDLVAEPDVAAEIVVRGMKLGLFTGYCLADYISDSETDFLGARKIVNRQDRAVVVARYARGYEAALRNISPTGRPRANVSTIQRQLQAIGWPLVVDGIFGTFTRRALTDFQAGYCFEQLTPNGSPNGTTTRALARCAAGRGRASPSFRFIEFRTGGSHKLSLNNQVISVKRDLIVALEHYRRLAGEPVQIASGYRSVGYNYKIGGSPNCQHLLGSAVDVLSPRLPVPLVVELGVFTGIGSRSSLTEHLEVVADGSTEQRLVWAMDD